MLLSKIPGLTDVVNAAVREEEIAREFAFSGLPTDICGLEVEQFRLRHLRQAIIIGSPFVHGGEVASYDVLEFLWIVSTIQPKSNKTAKKAFLKRICHVRADWKGGIRAYISDATMDSPGSGDDDSAPIVSASAAILHAIGNCGWTRTEVEDAPLAALFQMMRLSTIKANPKAIFINRLSDAARKQAVRKFQDSKK